jgi:hypothetical protein
MIKKINAYSLVEKPEWMKPFGRPRHRLENGIKIFIQGVIFG